MSGLVQAAIGLVNVTGWLALTIGMGLLLAPQFTLQLSARCGQYDPLIRVVSWMDGQRFIERYVYRHHRAFGAFIVLGALYTSYYLAVTDVAAVTPEPVASLALLVAVRFLWVTNLALVFFGVTVFVRPSALKGLEKWANRWITLGSERGSRAEGSLKLAEWLAEKPRVAGAALLGLGMYFVSLVTIG